MSSVPRLDPVSLGEGADEQGPLTAYYPRRCVNVKGPQLDDNWSACIEDPVVIKKILDHLKQKAEANEPSPLRESCAPPMGLFA